jgi:excisionase family DNA binding protein
MRPSGQTPHLGLLHTAMPPLITDTERRPSLLAVEPPPAKFVGRLRPLRVCNRMTVYLTVREVAAMARCEHKSVRRAIATGRLRAFQPTNKLLIREDDAYAWIEGRPAATASPVPGLPPAPSRRRPALGSQRRGSVADLREIERKVVQA